MNEQSRLSAVVFLVVFLLGLHGMAHADDPATDENYVKIRLPVEIRGIVRQTEKGIFLETKEEVQLLFPGSFANKSDTTLGKTENQTRWELYPGGPKIAGKGVATLIGKTVVVTGHAELRQVSVKVEVPSPLKWYKFTTLEPQRKVTVSDVKVVDQK